jgi:hypothetical protein
MKARSLVPTSLGEVAQPFKKLINKTPKRTNWTMAYERFFIAVLHQKIVPSRWQSTITDVFASGCELIANNQAPQDGTISGSVLPAILRRQRIGNR